MVTIPLMNEQFSGHELETGLLQRVRAWRDVFPLIGLVPALRVCGSPLYMTLWLAITAVVTWPLASDIESIVLDDVASTHPLWFLAAFLIASLPATMTMRAGALYAAGRDDESIIANIKWVASRLLTLLFVFILPSVCVLGLSVPLAALGLIDRLPGVGENVSELLSVLALPLVILIGLVAAGSVIAVPIGWAAVSIEKRNDAFDALSRGYEYLYRRPVQTMIYLFVCGLLTVLVSSITYCVAWAGELVASQVHWLASGGNALPTLMQRLLMLFPAAAALCTFFSTFGAMYLLLRNDANQQEVEDVAVSAIDRRRSEMPTLKTGGT